MLAESADGVGPERDAKLEELKSLIETKVTQPSFNNQGESNRKVIVFCAFADKANRKKDRKILKVFFILMVLMIIFFG